MTNLSCSLIKIKDIFRILGRIIFMKLISVFTLFSQSNDYSPAAQDLAGMGMFFASFLLISLSAFFISAAGFRKRLLSRYLKGARLGDKNSYIELIRRKRKKARIELCGIPIPVSEETKGFFFTGKPGVGKSLSFYNILGNLKKEGKKIVYDFKGDYVSKFYDEKYDLIFNPMDKRSVKWDIFRELSGDEVSQAIMTERIASSVVPDSPGKMGNNEKFWRDGAREVFAAIINYLRLENRRSNSFINEMLSRKPAEIGACMRAYKVCANAVNFISPPDSLQAGGIMATLTQFTKFFRFMDYRGEGVFSIKDWLSDGRDGTIFIVNKSDLQDILRPMLTLFIDLLIGGILSLSEDRFRRIYLMIDEMGTLHPLESLVSLLTFGRSKGASAWLAVQDFSQIDHIYGEDRRKTILNACTTHVYFSVADNSTAELISRLIGEQEAVEESITSGPGGSFSATRYKQKKPVLLPSEIMRMEPFEFLYRGNLYHPFFGALDPSSFENFPDRSEPFIMKHVNPSGIC